MIMGTRQRLATFNNYELSVSRSLNNMPLRQVRSTKTLGLTLDENLTWRNHVEVITKKISSGIGALKKPQLKPIKVLLNHTSPTVPQYRTGSE